MIRVKQIDHINMRVRNLDQSIEFYQRSFGFQMKEDRRDDPKGPWAIIGLRGVAYLCLYEHPGKRQAERSLRINHFGFVIENFDEAMAQLSAAGVEILYGGPLEWAHSRSIYIRDPSGHEIELAEKTGGGLD